MHVRVSLCVRMCVCVYVCTCVYSCTHVCVRVHVYVSAYLGAFVCSFVSLCVCARACTCVLMRAEAEGGLGASHGKPAGSGGQRGPTVYLPQPRLLRLQAQVTM